MSLKDQIYLYDCLQDDHVNQGSFGKNISYNFYFEFLFSEVHILNVLISPKSEQKIHLSNAVVPNWGAAS